MKRWVETRFYDFPTEIVSGRFGGSVMFVAYDKWRRQWMWIQPNSREERIEEPTEIYVESEWAEAHLLPHPRPKRSGKMRKQKEEQLFLI